MTLRVVQVSLLCLSAVTFTSGMQNQNIPVPPPSINPVLGRVSILLTADAQEYTKKHQRDAWNGTWTSPRQLQSTFAILLAVQLKKEVGSIGIIEPPNGAPSTGTTLSVDVFPAYDSEGWPYLIFDVAVASPSGKQMHWRTSKAKIGIGRGGGEIYGVYRRSSPRYGLPADILLIYVKAGEYPHELKPWIDFYLEDQSEEFAERFKKWIRQLKPRK